MRIRAAEAARDAAPCAAIYAPFVEGSAVSFEYSAPTAEEFGRRIERYSTTHAWLVAEDTDRVVGFAYATPHRERAAYRWATEVSIYVDPADQRRGAGRALYRELFEVLGGQGYRIALAGIALPNEASVAMHESLGFEPIGIYRRIGFKDGAWHDVGWWQRPLGPQDAEPGPLPG
jgi:L-amino acid N-acyltransferase YncA